MIGKIVEGFVIRALPGLINLWVLLLVAERLQPEAFGLYSTGVAVAGFISSVLFGPLTFSIVAHHAKHDVAGNIERYEANVFTAAFILCWGSIALAIIADMLGLLKWEYIFPGIALGFYSVVLEFPRARLKIWLYGTASLVQSILFLALTFLFIQESDDTDLALSVFSLSYALAAIVSLGLSGWPKLIGLDFRLLWPSLRAGAGYTLSIAFENGLYLGMRFVVMIFAAPQQLGIFSFSVDLAQRVIGIFANITSFVVVPIAFKNSCASDDEFKSVLYEGGKIAFFMCLLALAGILVVHEIGLVPALSGPLFDSFIFSIIGTAIIVSRIKKIVVDPYVLHKDKSVLLPFGFAIAAPISLSLAVIFQGIGSFAAPFAYLIGYVLATIITTLGIRFIK